MLRAQSLQRGDACIAMCLQVLGHANIKAVMTAELRMHGMHIYVLASPWTCKYQSGHYR